MVFAGSGVEVAVGDGQGEGREVLPREISTSKEILN
jgi:hypothetical protein